MRSLFISVRRTQPLDSKQVLGSPIRSTQRLRKSKAQAFSLLLSTGPSLSEESFQAASSRLNGSLACPRLRESLASTPPTSTLPNGSCQSLLRSPRAQTRATSKPSTFIDTTTCRDHGTKGRAPIPAPQESYGQRGESCPCCVDVSVLVLLPRRSRSSFCCWSVSHCRLSSSAAPSP